MAPLKCSYFIIEFVLDFTGAGGADLCVYVCIAYVSHNICIWHPFAADHAQCSARPLFIDTTRLLCTQRAIWYTDSERYTLPPRPPALALDREEVFHKLRRVHRSPFHDLIRGGAFVMCFVCQKHFLSCIEAKLVPVERQFLQNTLHHSPRLACLTELWFWHRANQVLVRQRTESRAVGRGGETGRGSNGNIILLWCHLLDCHVWSYRNHILFWQWPRLCGYTGLRLRRADNPEYPSYMLP